MSFFSVRIETCAFFYFKISCAVVIFIFYVSESFMTVRDKCYSLIMRYFVVIAILLALLVYNFYMEIRNF